MKIRTETLRDQFAETARFPVGQRRLRVAYDHRRASAEYRHDGRLLAADDGPHHLPRRAIYDDAANIIQAQLLFLESVDPEKDIQIYINSPGGSVSAGLGIYDTMQLVNSDVATICTGLAASMGAVLLTAGAKGKRSALPHSRVMIHQPLGGAQGQASDIEITAREIMKTKRELYEILSAHSGVALKKIEKDADRDYWLSAREAKEYGLIDEVLSKRGK